MKLKLGIVRYSELIIVCTIWTLVFAAPILIYQDNQQMTFSDVLASWEVLTPFFTLFLINHLILVPLLLFKNRKTAYLLSVVLLLSTLAAYSFITRPAANSNLLQRHPPGTMLPHNRTQINPPGGPQTPPRQPIRRLPVELPPYVNMIIISMLVIGFDTGLRMMVRWSKLEQEKTVLEKENVQSQLAFLRTQISPHFFMNTLNNIHSQIDINSEDAKDSIIKLSKLMRHLLYDSQEEKTSLNKEVEFIKSYINLMKLRFSDKVNIRVEIPENLPDKQIPPLLFTSLIENAFKHGISYSNGSFIHLKMDVEDKKLIFNLINSKANKMQSDKNKGIGLENTKKRLDLLFAENYSLDINNNDNSFTVKLEIPI